MQRAVSRRTRSTVAAAASLDAPPASGGCSRSAFARRIEMPGGGRPRRAGGESGRALTRYHRRPYLATLAVLAIVIGSLIPSASAAAATPNGVGGAYQAGRYIVTFADPAVVDYDGSVAGYPATRARAGHKIDASSPAVRRWQQR